MTLPRSDFHVESPFILTTTHEQGDRVVQAYRLEEISFGWVKAGGTYDSREVLASWAEECWRWWWGHVFQGTQTRRPNA